MTREHPIPSAKDEGGVIDLSVGSIIADRYRLEKQIGQGGTAVVFRATDLELEEEVALKVFTVVVDDPDLIRRFKQELRARPIAGDVYTQATNIEDERNGLIDPHTGALSVPPGLLNSRTVK